MADAPKNSATADVQQSKPQDMFLLDKLYEKPKTIFSIRTPHVRALSENCLFVFDTNALLAPYKIGAGEAEEISRIFNELAKEDRVFVPSRVAQEFAKNQHIGLKNLYDTIHGWSSKLVSPQDLSAKCPMLEGRDSYNEFLAACEAMKEARKKYAAALTKIMGDLREWCWDDPISQLYSTVFTEDRVIDRPVMSHEDIKKELDYRQNNNVPPGYKDRSKADEGVGDLLIWLTLIKIAVDQSRDILFVCNEEKPDWMVRSHDETLIVRPELTHEFQTKTGFYFDIINFSTFLTLRNATEGVVSRARSIEDDNTISDWEVAKHLLDVLSSISTLLMDYVDAANSSNWPPPCIEDYSFDALTSRFRTLKFRFDVSGQSVLASGILKVIEDLLIEIQQSNNTLKYILARMKQSGENEANRLRTACDRFFTAFEDWLAWYSESGSPL